MAVSFITRLPMLALGYVYPAYDCYKTLELNNPQIKQLRFWCQYWILLAFLMVFERITDCTASWLPMYGEAKLALVVYLWYPKTRDAKHVYDSYLQPLLARHEADIDRNLQELRARAKDVTASHLEVAVAFGQTWFLEIFRCISSQLQAARGCAGQIADQLRVQIAIKTVSPNSTSLGQPRPRQDVDRHGLTAGSHARTWP